MFTVTRGIAISLLMLPMALVHSQSSSGRVAVVGSSLGNAIAAYAETTNDQRLDCDPVGDGRWICANFVNPTLADVGGSTGSSPAVAVPSAPSPIAPVPAPTTPEQSNGRAAVVASTLAQARANLESLTGNAYGPGSDCDPVGDGRWVCANFQNPNLSDVGAAVSAPSSPAPVIPAPQPSDPVARPVNAREGIPSDSSYRVGDLILMQYDSCPDADDLHAAVAGKMVLDHFGLVNGRDYVVSNGTCGAERPRNDYIQNSPLVFNKVYGQSWNDAYNDEANSAVRVAEMVKNALNAGRNVHVMDGGPMDFTSRVVRLVEANGVSNLRRIAVYQHSAGWNRRFTGDDNLAYLLSRVTYVEVPNGNLANNGSAQLNQQNSGDSNYPRVDQALVNRFRNNSVYGDQWRVAFSILNPDNRFDGSDTVELLWLLGLRADDIANWGDFANRFLPGSNQSPSTPVSNPAPQPAQPTQPSQPAQGNVVRFEAESANLGSGWVRETTRSGFSGAGYIRWNGGNQYTNPGQGTTSYTFSVSSAGTYQLRIKARAISPPRGDLNNDSWFKMNGQNVNSSDFTQWTKIFTTGQDNWQTGGTADVENRGPFMQRLEAGRSYVLQLSGRSQSHAIDVIELVKQ